MAPTVQLIQDLAVVFLAAAVGGVVCKRLGLSPIVGYLAGGILVGPATPLEALIRDPARVNLLAQLGLVFLMFGIGLNFSLRRLRQLGLPLVGATALAAFLVFNLSRLGGGGLGLDRQASLFFAGMLVVSSSVMIGKTLTDAGRSHEKSSQLALGMTLAEDIVAIVMVALLGSYAEIDSMGQANAGSVIPEVAFFAGFVVVLGIVGLLVVPKILRRLSRDPSTQLENLIIAGVLLGLSVVVMQAGYSAALGGFILGAIIGETPHREQVDRSFGSLRDLFGAMFFVAIGMSVDRGSLPGVAIPVAVMVLLAVVGRTVAVAIALLFLGYDTRTAWRTGLILTPLGEFSFIIAQVGIGAGVFGSEYLTAAIGASLLTALISPFLARNNVAMAEKIAAVRIPLLDRALHVHRRMLIALDQRQRGSLLWRLLKKRLVQISVEILMVSTVLFFAPTMIDWIVTSLDPQWIPGVDPAVVCWLVLGVIALAPLIAIWRNTQAVSMILADHLSHLSQALYRTRSFVSAALQTVALLALILWFWNFVPIDGGLWLTVSVFAIFTIVAAAFWRQLIRWHSHLEFSLNTAVEGTDSLDQRSYTWLDRYARWGLEIGEVALPERFAFAGQSIGEIGIRSKFGASVVGIGRHSFTIANPGPDSRLFPGDHVLVLGTRDQIAVAREALLADLPAGTEEDTFRELTLDLFPILQGFEVVGKALAELDWRKRCGVQVVGVERNGTRHLTPGADLRLRAGDQILVLGTPRQLAHLGRIITPEDVPEGPVTRTPL